MPAPGRRIRRRAILIVTVTLLAFLAIGTAIRYVQERITDAYAVWWTSELVTLYMDSHQGHWPRNWDDLQQTYNDRQSTKGIPWPFSTLKQRVDVDFNTDPAQLLVHPRPVIRLKNGRQTHWQDADPNQRILTYLRSHP